MSAHKHLLTNLWVKAAFWLMVCLFIGAYGAYFLAHDGRMTTNGEGTIGRDFVNYWSGATLTLKGQAETLFSSTDYFAYLKAEFGVKMTYHNWSYPPHLLLIIWPLGLLPFVWAFVLWVGAGAAGFYYGCLRLSRNKIDAFVLLLAPATFICIYTGQNGFFTAALILAAYANLEKRPILAGVLIGLLTFKPQLGLLIPIVLLLMRRWKTFAAAGATSIFLVGLSIFVFGPQIWADYVKITIPLQQEILTAYTEPFTNMVPSAFMTAKNLGANPGAAWAAQSLVSAASLAALIWGFSRRRPKALLFALFCTATLLFTPYIVNYDMVILAPAVYAFYHYVRKTAPHKIKLYAPLLILLYVLPWLGQYASANGVHISLAALLMFLGLIVFRLHRAPNKAWS